MKSYQQLFAEFKRRHVFKVAGIYGIVAFGVLQVADLALPRLGLPDWTVTFMLALVLLAFPVVLIIAWAFEVTPDGVKKTDAPAPGEIERIVAAPMSQRWPAGLLALVGVVALLGSGWWLGRRTAPGSGSEVDSSSDPADVRLAMTDLADDDRASLAVLPFADMSSGGDQEYFGDGMAEEIINTLVKIRDLRVAGRTSAFAYKGQNKDLREIGVELGVGYLVEGSVRKEGDQLRITAQLIDTSDGSHLWSDSYDRPLANVFEIQSEIAESIAEELRVPLGLDGVELVRPTADLEAYDLYLAGRSKLRLRGAALAEAVELFEAAIARDSSWAPAWAGLAEANELMGWWDEAWDEVPEDLDAFNTRIEEYWTEAGQAARRALELDPDNASANVALGSVLRNRHEWQESEVAYLRALASDPDNPEAHQQYGTMLLTVGRLREGARATDRAAKLDRAPIRVNWQAWGMILDGNVMDATPILERALREFGSEPVDFSRSLTGAYLRAGFWGDPGAVFGVPDSLLGNSAAAIRQADASALPEAVRTIPATWLIIGERDSVMTRFGERLDRLDVTPAWVWDGALHPIHGEPAYQEALRVLNLEGRTPDRTPR